MKDVAVFIDRDGTINLDSGYVDSPSRFHILPGVPEAIKKLNDNKIPAIVVTNQSGIGRGYFTMEVQDTLHRILKEELARHGSHIEDIYICPHHPDDGCACRKPRPGMLLKAAQDWNIKLHASYMIGDKISDIQLAHNVGAKGILVLTGYGAEELRSGKARPDHVARNLKEAVNWILKDTRKIHEEKKILIVKPSSLGDIIHTLPVLYGLRKSYPGAHIEWVVKEEWKEILENNPLLDGLIILKPGVRGFMSALRTIREKRFDMVIDLQGLLRSGLLSYSSKAPLRIGFENAREMAHIFYNEKIPVPAPMHAVDRYCLVFHHLHDSLPLREIDKDMVFPLYTEIEDYEWTIKFLEDNGLKDRHPLIAINPFSRWEKKRWPFKFFLILIKKLICTTKGGIILLGSPEDIKTIGEDIKPLAKEIAIAGGKTSLKRLVALLERVDLLITNDSGPMHIGAAVGTKVVALFGPTSPALTGPYGEGHRVIRKDMECSPCFRKACVHGRPICMEAITVEEVEEVVMEKLFN